MKTRQVKARPGERIVWIRKRRGELYATTVFNDEEFLSLANEIEAEGISEGEEGRHGPRVVLYLFDGNYAASGEFLFWNHVDHIRDGVRE